MKTSGPTASPYFVLTPTGPDPVADGTVVWMLPLVADVASASDSLTCTMSAADEGSKFCPLIVSASPTAATFGETPEIDGLSDSTVNESALATVWPPAVTDTGPVVAPDGTAATISVL